MEFYNAVRKRRIIRQIIKDEKKREIAWDFIIKFLKEFSKKTKHSRGAGTAPLQV